MLPRRVLRRVRGDHMPCSGGKRERALRRGLLEGARSSKAEMLPSGEYGPFGVHYWRQVGILWPMYKSPK